MLCTEAGSSPAVTARNSGQPLYICICTSQQVGQGMYAYASREELSRRVVHSDLDRTRVRGFKSWKSIIISDTDDIVHETPIMFMNPL